MSYFLLRTLKIRTQKDIDIALQEVEHFVLLRVHFPFVTHPRGLHRENTHMTTIELNGQELDRRLGPNHRSRLRRIYSQEAIHWVPHGPGERAHPQPVGGPRRR